MGFLTLNNNNNRKTILKKNLWKKNYKQLKNKNKIKKLKKKLKKNNKKELKIKIKIKITQLMEMERKFYLREEKAESVASDSKVDKSAAAISLSLSYVFQIITLNLIKLSNKIIHINKIEPKL
jgi:hypothetical protein